MSELIEYFARHYTLVIDNDRSMYNTVRSAVRRVTRAADVTLSQYRTMSAEKRCEELASDIGEAVLEVVSAWFEESVSDRDHPGSVLANEIMILSGGSGELQWALGRYYLPEDSEADEFFIDTDEDDDED